MQRRWRRAAAALGCLYGISDVDDDDDDADDADAADDDYNYYYNDDDVVLINTHLHGKEDKQVSSGSSWREYCNKALEPQLRLRLRGRIQRERKSKRVDIDAVKKPLES